MKVFNFFFIGFHEPFICAIAIDIYFINEIWDRIEIGNKQRKFIQV